MPEPAPPTARYALNLLLDERERLLLLLRPAHARLGGGQWGLPAGKIEPGETPHDAALREMREEIGPGHDCELVRYLGPIRDTYYGGQFEIHLYQRRWRGGTVVLNEEHVDHAWVAADELRQYDVMLGIEEDIALLGFWPLSALNPERVPDYLKGGA
ncbi:MAG: NUDIX hydrolase [Gammaproteobacteria bacterium]